MKTRIFSSRPAATTVGQGARFRRPERERERRSPDRQPEEGERRESRLRELTADLFSALFAFRAASPESRPSYRAFRQEMVDLLAEFERRAERERADPNGDVLFALVALVDETAMNTQWDGAGDWARATLQMDYFHKEIAGDEFFERVNELQAQGDPEILEVYYLCLCAGFRGCYQDDPATVQSIRNRLLQRLSVFDLRHETHLTDEAYGRELQRPLVTQRFPFLLVLPFVLGAIICWPVCRYLLKRHVDKILPAPPAAAAPIQEAK